MKLINKQATSNITNSITFALLSGRLFFGKLTVLINVLAALVSWDHNHHFGWAIFHYLFGWWYMLYSLLLYRFADGKFLEIIQSFF